MRAPLTFACYILDRRHLGYRIFNKDLLSSRLPLLMLADKLYKRGLVLDPILVADLSAQLMSVFAWFLSLNYCSSGGNRRETVLHL